jgi:hypothetical protein
LTENFFFSLSLHLTAHDSLFWRNTLSHSLSLSLEEKLRGKKNVFFLLPLAFISSSFARYSKLSVPYVNVVSAAIKDEQVFLGYNVKRTK